MRRRQPVAAGAPPAELREYDPQVWAGAVPDADESAPACRHAAREAETSPGNLAFAAWLEARERWRVAFGWPVDSVEFCREEVRAILERVDQDAA